MVQLARIAKGEKHVSLRSLAEEENISIAYLEQIFAVLRRAELVYSVRGAQGGYALSRKPEDIRIGDVVLALEGPTEITRCVTGSPSGCRADHARCLTHDLWEKLGQHIDAYLNSVSLNDVLEHKLLLSSMSEKVAL